MPIKSKVLTPRHSGRVTPPLGCSFAPQRLSNTLVRLHRKSYQSYLPGLLLPKLVMVFGYTREQPLQGGLCLQVGKDKFSMDFQSPMSALQAFEVCLTSFDGKLACE